MEPHWIYYWRVTDATGKRYTTRHRATEEDIRAQQPTARAFERIDSGKLWINGVPARAHNTSFFSPPQHMRKQTTPPIFERGSGWHRNGATPPGTPAAVQALRDAALPCVVYPMRLKGQRRPIAELLNLTPVAGALIVNDDFTKPNWTAFLYQVPDMAIVTMSMHEIDVTRARGGFRQISGIEWGEKAMARWQQTWFCAPNVEAARGVLSKMATSA
ncbi:hypothetical protein [Pseudorhodoferax sp. Leaf265]|uniref:hypothetical protein n=1 Tax=Pseudorhodoferax sp. Leaf265 TaxID=1736315 RepID=UPI0006F425B7|nr:hypothetical protein [Pseudorhodoferax sp. Leaf265]KQP02439.1 hypothetical protein ASF45_20510 [Pseudorhodoferax sp. Leaf265]